MVKLGTNKSVHSVLADLVHAIRHRLLTVKILFSRRDLQDTFTDIHRINYWRNTDSLSGSGSDLEQTRVIRNQIPRLLSEYGFRVLLDAPCGDFHWMAHTDLQGIRYIGGDVVRSIVERNSEQFSSESRSFRLLDLTSDELPGADVLLCRDCLVHLDYASISQVVRRIKESNIPYVLTTSYSGPRRNHDIITGQWRPLNLQRPPFSWPSPLDVILEESTEDEGIYADKSLMLWATEDIPVDLDPTGAA